MPIALLPDRAVVAVSGPDATAFLQGILTCNVETLPEGEARLGALLTPQGKIQFVFFCSLATAVTVSGSMWPPSASPISSSGSVSTACGPR